MIPRDGGEAKSGRVVAQGHGLLRRGDYEPDASSRPAEYYRAFAQLVCEGTRPETHIEIAIPVITRRKSEIVRRGAELGAPFDCTWSCYQFNDGACGTCDSCRLRLQAFGDALLRDPLPYRAGVAQ
jgi:7-cyano-7-deazaguanine synthase